MARQNVSLSGLTLFQSKNLSCRKIIHINDIEVAIEIERDLAPEKILYNLACRPRIARTKRARWIQYYNLRACIRLNKLPDLFLGQVFALCIMRALLELLERCFLIGKAARVPANDILSACIDYASNTVLATLFQK